ncbi:MAG: alpha/beta hydrolase [Bauldia sp.]|nr:alpha/beta hydrolase [Bauldia sp.]
MRRLNLLAVVGLAACLAAPACAFERVGVVLLHGKTGTPAQFETVAGTLIEAGFAVETPEMCWSAGRLYDDPFAECMSDVDTAIGYLRRDGVNRIVIGGHSLGALGALGYAATHEGLAGVIVLGAAGDPGDFNTNPAVAKSIRTAETMVAAGNGGVTADFTDRVLGRNFTVRTTADAFLSFLGPDSPLAIRHTLPAIDAPLLWIAGTKDGSQRNAAALFAMAPDDAMSRLVKVSANHLGTPDAGTSAMITWLTELEDR